MRVARIRQADRDARSAPLVRCADRPGATPNSHWDRAGWWSRANRVRVPGWQGDGGSGRGQRPQARSPWRLPGRAHRSHQCVSGSAAAPLQGVGPQAAAERKRHLRGQISNSAARWRMETPAASARAQCRSQLRESPLSSNVSTSAAGSNAVACGSCKVSLLARRLAVPLLPSVAAPYQQLRVVAGSALLAHILSIERLTGAREVEHLEGRAQHGVSDEGRPRHEATPPRPPCSISHRAPHDTARDPQFMPTELGSLCRPQSLPCDTDIFAVETERRDTPTLFVWRTIAFITSRKPSYSSSPEPSASRPSSC